MRGCCAGYVAMAGGPASPPQPLPLPLPTPASGVSLVVRPLSLDDPRFPDVHAARNNEIMIAWLVRVMAHQIATMPQPGSVDSCPTAGHSYLRAKNSEH